MSDIEDKDAALIERLIRERDEAREGLARITEFYRETFNEYSEKLADEVHNVNQLIQERNEAEQRGYRRGVQDALDKVRKEKALFQSEGYAGGPANAVAEIFACHCCEEKVAALLEKSEPSLSPEDKPA